MTSRSFLVRLQVGWGLALVFAIPLTLHYITKEPFAISGLNLVSVGFIGLGVINLVTKQLKYQPLPHRPFWVMVGLLLLALGWGLLFTDPLRNGIGLWTSRLTQPLLVGFMMYQLFANRLISILQVVKALMLSLVPLLVFAGLQWSGSIPYLHTGRITANYFYPNTFARYVEIILLVGLPWIVFAPRLTGRRVWLGLWLLGVGLLLSTKSYNGTVSFGLGLMAMLVFLPRSFRAVKMVSLTVLAVIVLVVGFNVTRLPKWQVSVQDSRITRLEFWGVAQWAIADHFWTGIGIKTWETRYTELLRQYGPVNPHLTGSVQPHNVYLDSFIKAGLPGFVAIVTLLLWPLFEGRALVRRYGDHRPDWWFGLSMIGWSVAMLAFGVLDDPLWSDDVMPLLFILFFLLAGAMVRPRRNEVSV